MNGGEIYFWNFCGGQATLYYFHLVWESMPFYSALVRLTPGGLECESSSPASSSLGASSPFVIHKNKRSRSEYPSPAGSSLGASLTIEEEEYRHCTGSSTVPVPLSHACAFLSA